MISVWNCWERTVAFVSPFPLGTTMRAKIVERRRMLYRHRINCACPQALVEIIDDPPTCREIIGVKWWLGRELNTCSWCLWDISGRIKPVHHWGGLEAWITKSILQKSLVKVIVAIIILMLSHHGSWTGIRFQASYQIATDSRGVAFCAGIFNSLSWRVVK